MTARRRLILLVLPGKSLTGIGSFLDAVTAVFSLDATVVLLTPGKCAAK